MAEAAAAADFLEDNTVADSKVCWVGEIILGEVAVKLELAPPCELPEVAFAIGVTMDDASDDAGVVVVVVVALVAEMVGSLSIVVADVTAAVSAAVTAVAVVAFVVVVVEEDDDKCNVAFFV